jgi:hypothetical protein
MPVPEVPLEPPVLVLEGDGRSLGVAAVVMVGQHAASKPDTERKHQAARQHPGRGTAGQTALFAFLLRGLWGLVIILLLSEVGVLSFSLAAVMISALGAPFGMGCRAAVLVILLRIRLAVIALLFVVRFLFVPLVIHHLCLPFSGKFVFCFIFIRPRVSDVF